MTLLKKNSLRFRLIWILSISALVIWSVSTSIAWFQAKKEINQMFDMQQILFAKRLTSSDLGSMLFERKSRMNAPIHPRRPKHYDDDALAFAIFTRDGFRVVSDDAKGNNIPFAPSRGFNTMIPTGESEPWRIFWMPYENHHFLIAVGQKQSYRDSIVEEMVFAQMWVWLAGLPVLIALMIFLITREINILRRVGNEMQERSPESVQPLSTQRVPSEILPLVNGLNDFFDRTSAMLQRERRFTSDAAHELRSPLAGLRVQAEIAQMLGDDATLRDNALNNLTQGIDRATQVIEQLLTLSRLDNLNQLDDLQMISWHELSQSVISELYFKAEKCRMTLVLEEIDKPIKMQGQPVLLSLMLRNVIDNGLKYCPSGTQIKVRLEKNVILVEDNGVGVSDDDLAKLGQRFYRPAGQNEKGSGLGLSIVLRIAELHHIHVKLENIRDDDNHPKGLRVIFHLPSK